MKLFNENENEKQMGVLEFLERMHRNERDNLRSALSLIHILIYEQIEKERIPTGNVYELEIEPLVDNYLTDWKELWGQTKDHAYNVAGNIIFIKSGTANKITKLND